MKNGKVILVFVLAFLLTGCYSSPSLNGTWFASLPYSDDRFDITLYMELTFGIDTEEEGELVGQAQITGRAEMDEGQIEFVEDYDFNGDWRLDQDQFYVTLSRINGTIDPDNCSFTPNLSNEDGFMAAVGPELLNSLLGSLTSFSLPVDRFREVGKQFVVKQIQAESNNWLKEWKGKERLLGTIAIGRKSFSLQTNTEGIDVMQGDEGIIDFYRL